MDEIRDKRSTATANDGNEKSVETKSSKTISFSRPWLQSKNNKIKSANPFTQDKSKLNHFKEVHAQMIF